LEALRASLVDASAVSGTLWLSYLFAVFYLLVAIGGVTDKDLLLESPVKLPFLNVDLPLKGFFWLGPALFLILHAYVLLHFAMLAGKANAFDTELRRQIPDRDTRARLRRQLPISIFVQLLAGPMEARTGATGWLLRLIAVISLVLGPVALLLFFLLQFLPYQNEPITWWERIAVLLDLGLLWALWPALARPDVQGAWRHQGRPLRQLRVFVWRARADFRFVVVRFRVPSPVLVWPERLRRWRVRRQLRVLGRRGRNRLLSVAARLRLIRSHLSAFARGRFVLLLPSAVALPLAVLATFPGEWLYGVVSALPILQPLRTTLFEGEPDPILRRPESLFSNRLVLPEFDVIDHTKFDTKEKVAALPVTARLRGRDLQRAVLIGATMPKADLTGAHLQGASLDEADLQGASLNLAHLQGAVLDWAQLQGASLNLAHLQGASLDQADLQGAFLIQADLEGATLDRALLEATILNGVCAWRADGRGIAGRNVSARGLSAERPNEPGRHCAWGEEDFRKLKEQLTHEIPAGTLRDAALSRIDPSLDPGRPLTGETEMAAAWVRLRDGTPPPQEFLRDFETVIGELGCRADGAPYVLTRLVENLADSGFRHVLTMPRLTLPRPTLRRLAQRWLAPACGGARGLPDDARSVLTKWAEPQAAGGGGH